MPKWPAWIGSQRRQVLERLSCRYLCSLTPVSNFFPILAMNLLLFSRFRMQSSPRHGNDTPYDGCMYEACGDAKGEYICVSVVQDGNKSRLHPSRIAK